MSKELIEQLAINKTAQLRYDELMREGKHGHYETMFKVIHEAIKAYAQTQGQSNED